MRRKEGSGRHASPKANVETWHKVWEALLEASGPLSVEQIMGETGLGRSTVESALTSLSGHWIPVYEEKVGGLLYFGVAKVIEHEEVDEIIRYTNDKEQALGRRVEIKNAREEHKERRHG